MNAVTLDSMAFDHFEVVDRSSLSEIEGGNFGEGMLSAATTFGCAGGCAEGIAAVAAGTATVAIPIGWGVLAIGAAAYTVYAFTH
ncbi:hypothetical protein [Streptococcus mutans]|uniref:hypothetical protein n=1 Tax=Streptococcus mutans TaxID=1309 RepID=UPI0014555931|nr:hypothetical protein [Streptococcus mutans]NLQ74193.1 hypothetical protein [Streptococcus mutans]